MRPPPPHGAQSAPWGPRERRDERRAGSPVRLVHGGVQYREYLNEEQRSQPGPPTRQPRWGGGGMQRRPNAAGVSPRAASQSETVEMTSVRLKPAAETLVLIRLRGRPRGL